jgi:hypothetical protein
MLACQRRDILPAIVCAMISVHGHILLASSREAPEPVVHDTRSPEDPVFPVPDYRDGKYSDTDRNIMITKNYRIFSEKLRETIDCPVRSAGISPTYTTNWLHLATWASRSAGDFISDEQHKFLEWVVRNWLGRQRDSVKNRMLAFLAGRMPEGIALGGQKNEIIVNTIKRLLALGNWVVAQEVQNVTAAFIDSFSGACDRIAAGNFDVQMNGQKFLRNHFKQDIADRSFESVLTEAMVQINGNLVRYDNGERYIGEADMLLALGFRIYFEVMTQPRMATKRRQQLIYLANILIGVHEQHVLQTYIRGALSSFDVISPEIKELFGATVMRLGVPKGSLGCSDSVVKNLDQVKFNRKVSIKAPPSLQQFEEAELKFAAHGLELSDGLGDGVDDWTNYQGRIKFIAAVYRGLHENQDLTGSPYLGWCPIQADPKVHVLQ